MDLFEHQARELFSEHGVPVAAAELAATPGEAREAARRLGGRMAVKAQVRTGGRGKAGGVRIAAGPAAAEQAAREILGTRIRGHAVHSVLVAEAVDVAREFYVSYALDRAAGTFLAVVSAEGGTEIEDVAAARPEAVARVAVDPSRGVTPAVAARICAAGGLPAAAAPVLVALWRVLVGEDALLVEVNPLAETADGRVVALDGKVVLDDNARFRHARWAGGPADPDADPLEAAAARSGLTYVRLDGEVGVVGNGAGLVMSTLDAVAGCGARPANFLDIGGGASARVMADGLAVILSDPSVRSVLVNVFGGITACDAVADGIVRALGTVSLTRPLVVRLDGNNAQRGREILARRAHPLVEQAGTMEGAADRAAVLARASRAHTDKEP